MKKLSTLFVILAITISVFAQSPQKISYQAVVRNSGGVLMANQTVGIKISILKESVSGTVVFSETYSPAPQTNANGLITIEIGSGTPVTGTFSSIDWATGPYFIKTETDPAGGTDYSITGTSQILSVPYALYANTSGNGTLWSKSGSNIYFNTGNVGIGITDPLESLHVNGSVLLSTGDKKLLIFTQGTGEDIMSTNTLHLNHHNNQNVSIGEAGTSNLLVSGNVGIGTTSPGTKLDVNGVITAIGGNSTNWNLAFGWGNHADLYRPISWVPTWSDVTGKPSFATVATSGSFADLSGKPTTLAGYGITNGMSTSHPANVITSTNITNWNTAYGWGNHTGLYRPISWVPTWSDVTGKPTFATVATTGSYNDLTNKPTIVNSQWINNGSNIYYTNGYVGIGTTAPSAGLHITANTWPGSFIYLESASGQDAGLRLYEGTDLKWHIYNNANAGGLLIQNYGLNTTLFCQQSTGNVGIGDMNPSYKLDVAGNLNINKGRYGDAFWCNGAQALWYDGTYFSWGYGGTYNYFADPITIGNVTNPTGYALWVQGNAWATGSWLSSDARYKRNISEIDNALEKLLKIRGTKFEFRTDEFIDYQFAEGPQLGFIAQELENVFPEVVKTELNGYKSVNYSGIIPALVEAIKEQQKQIDELKQLVQRLLQE